MIDEKFVVNIDNLGKIPLNEIARDLLERFNFKWRNLIGLNE